ncbi:SDR family NAD(P)-dependent oxidoreductase, partial [Achromobacter animicus]|uniref:SDR family NAD(P)-dependent oxidoreductase n=2 Tax=Alcaligenaceae TaxID=506 RepID=UPI0028AAA381
MDNTTEVIHPELRGQTVVITGGAKGIGYSTAQAFARQGARVALLDMDAAALEAAVASLAATGTGAQAMAVQASVTDADAVERAFAQVAETWGGIDVLVNN